MDMAKNIIQQLIEEIVLEEVSKKTAKRQVKGLGGPKFKDKVKKAKKWGLKDPAAFVASRIKKATGKSPRQEVSERFGDPIDEGFGTPLKDIVRVGIEDEREDADLDVHSDTQWSEWGE